jgi:hypothetical protein
MHFCPALTFRSSYHPPTSTSDAPPNAHTSAACSLPRNTQLQPPLVPPNACVAYVNHSHKGRPAFGAYSPPLAYRAHPIPTINSRQTRPNMRRSARAALAAWCPSSSHDNNPHSNHNDTCLVFLLGHLLSARSPRPTASTQRRSITSLRASSRPTAAFISPRWLSSCATSVATRAWLGPLSSLSGLAAVLRSAHCYNPVGFSSTAQRLTTWTRLTIRPACTRRTSRTLSSSTLRRRAW